MDFSGTGKTLKVSRDTILKASLILITLWGFVTKFFLSWNFRLDSDTVGMGILSMEIGKHQNFLLSGCHVYASDSFFFTELVPFQLIPQILTNYNPLALKMMVFLIFILNVLTLAYLVWFVTRDLLPALLFSALAAVIPPDGYFWLGYPSAHNATILFGAVILILLFSLCRSLDEQKREKPQKTRKTRAPAAFAVPGSYTVALLVLVFLSVFSDTLILVWVLVPFVLVYAALFRQDHKELDRVVAAIVITSVIAYLIKTYAVSDWIRVDYTVNSISEIITVTFPLLFKALFLFLNQGLYTLMVQGTSTGPAEILAAALFIVVILWSAGNAWAGRNSHTPEKKLFLAFLMVSVLLAATAFMISGYVHGITAARYLEFTALAILLLVAVSCPHTDNTCMASVLLLLIISATAGTIYISTMDTNPNEREYGLIAYLQDQKLSFGYGTYWNSNVITYLSGEDVTVRSTYIAPDDLLPDRLYSCDRWFTDRPDRFFLIYDSTRPNDEAQKNYPLLKKTVNTTDVLQYRNYEVFLFHPA